jgi:hypothetical protein
MVWVYARTRSLLLMMLMHVSLTASTLILEPVAISGVTLMLLDLASIVAWWTVVTLIALANRGQFFETPHLASGAATDRIGAAA